MPATDQHETPWAPLLVAVRNDGSCWASALNAGMQAAGIGAGDLGCHHS